MPEIGERIKIFRKEARLSRQNLAKKIGVSSRSLAYYEAGEIPPRMETVKKIAESLSIDIQDLIDRGKDDLEGPLCRIGTGKDIFTQACADLTKIFQSADQALIIATMANLLAFSRAVDTQKENESLRKEIADLKVRLDLLEQKLIDKG